MDAELLAYLDARFAELRAEIAAGADGVTRELRAEIAASATGVERELTRHFDVVVEDLISRIELVGEGVRMVGERLDRFQDEVREEFRSVDRRFLHLQAQVSGRGRRRPGR